MSGEATIEPIRWEYGIDGRLTESALRAKLERHGYSVSRYIYPSGTLFPDHTHAVDKMDAVVSGRFRMVVDGKEIVLKAGDILHVGRGVVHSAEEIGDEPVVSLDGVKM